MPSSVDILSGLVFVARVTPLESSYTLARTGLSLASSIIRNEALARQWELWGAVALVLPLVALAFMVLKP